MTARSLNGLVLAGGRSERMGTDKASLLHPDGRTLGRRGVELLKAGGCGRVLLSLRADQPLPRGMEDFSEDGIVRDPPEGSRGPLSGMIAAMEREPEADWLVVACDLPRLDLRTLRVLVGERCAGEAFLAFRSAGDGLPEPLCAIYGEGALAVLREAVSRDFRCPRKILIQRGCRLLEPVDERALDNANTRDDWERSIR